jgi:hypothetical protein
VTKLSNLAGDNVPTILRRDCPKGLSLMTWRSAKAAFELTATRRFFITYLWDLPCGASFCEPVYGEPQTRRVHNPQSKESAGYQKRWLTRSSRISKCASAKLQVFSEA